MAVKRVGMVIGVREERLSEYRALHADTNAGVRDLLAGANIRNFSIFVDRLPDGKHYLFGYYEYDGHDYEADMAALASTERNKQWLALTDPMQIPLPGLSGWKPMEQVYYNP